MTNYKNKVKEMEEMQMNQTNEEREEQRIRQAKRVKELKEQGLNNTMIAKRMGISPNTVKRRLEHD